MHLLVNIQCLIYQQDKKYWFTAKNCSFSVFIYSSKTNAIKLTLPQIGVVTLRGWSLLVVWRTLHLLNYRPISKSAKLSKNQHKSCFTSKIRNMRPKLMFPVERLDQGNDLVKLQPLQSRMEGIWCWTKMEFECWANIAKVKKFLWSD